MWGLGRSVCFSINEREGAGRGRTSAGQERHGSKAALLGAGEASEEVTMTVVLSRCQGVHCSSLGLIRGVRQRALC